MRRLLMATLAVTLIAAACTSSDSSGPTTLPTVPSTGSTGGGISAVAESFDPGSIRFVAALDRPGTCSAVLDRFRAEGLARVGPYGLEGGGGWYPRPFFGGFEGGDDGGRDFAESDTTAAAAGVPQSTESAGYIEGTDYSGTNVQVAGVDEPDFVKTDGEHIYVLNDGRLTIFAVDGATITRVGGTSIDGGWNHQMLVSGDRIFVFTTADVWALPAVFAPEVIDERVQSQTPSSIITEIDVSDPSSPGVVSTLKVDGAYLSARSIDGTMRVVVSSYPANLPFVYPSGPAAEQIAEESNRRVIEQSTIEDWLPSYTLARGGEIVETGLMADCERVHFPAEFSGFSALSVLTIDMGAGLTGDGAAVVVADGETVYASTESLYVATSVWVPSDLVGDSSIRELTESWSTSIHRFDISGTGQAEYLASGSIDGHLLNQFSMDELDGRLRVAVTEGPPWGFDEQSESAVVVMNRDGDRLVEVGRVGELGLGERIFSVRFVGDVAYVVTFRQVDPLYVIDLSDPTSPVVAAELKIPGYSSYLHPMGDGRVLGIGQDATDEGFTTGTKVSLFDVSDPANPIEVDVWTMPDGYSDAEWDHLAFLYWAPTETAVLPVTIWQEGFAGAVVLGTDDGLRERGRIAHDPDEVETVDSGCDPVAAGDLTEWINDEGVTVQVCGGDDPGGATGKYCETWYVEDVDELRYEFLTEDAEVELAEGDRVEVCWPNYELQAEPIRRSLVIGDTVWTITYNTIQGNDLGTLEVTDIAGL